MFIIFLSRASLIQTDYTPQYIGLAGTLMGTLLGWLLSHVSNNIGRIKTTIEKKELCKSESQQFAYLIKIFMYNNSFKPKHIRNLKIKFYKKRTLLLKEIPRIKDSNFDYVGILSNEKAEIVLMNPFEAKSVTLCDIIENNEYTQILSADKIILSYENDKGKTKKICIQKNFSINNISMFTNGKRFV